MMNTFYHGDCLFVMNHDIEPNSVDLIYLDPPFFTGKVQTGTEWKPGEMPITYDDSKRFWGESVKVNEMRENSPDWLQHIAQNRPEFASYLYYMMLRLKACHRVLKPTGSIYLHCDWRASHYLKMIMDEPNLFGMQKFQNEIVWCYSGPSVVKSHFARKHDTILFYKKGDNGTFNLPRVPYTAKLSVGGKASWAGKECDIDGYLAKGKACEDWWTNMPALQRNEMERMGYPTQKPIALLERIILASSNEGDVVLDPFCGCGTAIIAAHKNNRQWVGIDKNIKAWEVILERANQPSFYQWQNSFKEATYVSRDLDEVLAIKKPKGKDSFEEWVNGILKATKPSPDKGVDGITKDNIPIQTKTFEVTYSYLSNLVAAATHHPQVKKPFDHVIIVSQKGFDDSARQRQFEIQTKEGIKVDLLTPTKMLTDRQSDTTTPNACDSHPNQQGEVLSDGT